MQSVTRRKFALAAFFLLVGPLSASGAIEVLIGEIGSRQSALDCRYFYLETLYPLSGRRSLDLDNQWERLVVTKDQIYDTYRQLGTVPESEIESLMKEDALFPARSVIYLRSVSEVDGRVEGIMRVVSGPVPGPTYFNTDFAEKNRHWPARTPIEAKYQDPAFQKFLNVNFPYRSEMGRVVFGKGVNEFRVLMDLNMAAAEMLYLPEHSKKDHYLLVEAVRPARRRYLEMGMLEVPTTQKFNDERILMAMPVKEGHDRLIGNIKRALAEFDSVPFSDKATKREKIKLLDEAIAKVSGNPTLQRFYTFGLYHRAECLYSIDDFQGMLKDVKELVRRSPNNKEVKVFQLFAEAGSRFNWGTGEGEAKKALAYLDSEEARKLFSDEAMPEWMPGGMRDFVKGLVYLGNQDLAGAKSMKQEMENRRLQKEEKVSETGGVLRTLSIDELGRVRVDHLRRDITDPLRTLEHIEVALSESPVGLSAPLFFYQAEILTKLGRQTEAARALEKAQALKD